MRRLPALTAALAALLALAAAPAFAVSHDTARDRADAQAFVAAAAPAMQRITVIGSSFGQQLKRPACDNALAHVPAARKAAVSMMTMFIFGSVATFQQLEPVYRSYSAQLERVHATDPALHAYAAYVKQTLLPLAQRFAAQPPFDACAILAGWGAAGWSDDFDWITAAHMKPALLEAALQPNAKVKALARKTVARLVALGVPAAQAKSAVLIGTSAALAWAVVPHPDLPSEQAYLDSAYAHLERMRETVERAAFAVDNEVAGLAMEAWARRRLLTFADAEQGLCFGRLDLDQMPRPLYVGRRWVHDDSQQVLVVNWQAPAARPFYTATPVDPQRVTLRRRFRTRGRRLLDLTDEALDGTALEGAAVSDFLLEELDRAREGRMRDIVATIQADQYRLITAEPDRALVVQGGPGTGKTAVGLHRASWLLFSFQDAFRRRGVLVVGPNPTFMEYVSHVLPALGEEAVEQRAVDALLDGVETGREDAPDAARLKADPRLAEVVRRAVELAVTPAPAELVVSLDGTYVRVRQRVVAELLEEALSSGLALGPARERLRIELVRRFYADYGARLGGAAFRDADEVERALRRNGFLGRYLDRVLGLPQPDRLVRRLLTSPSALAAAAAGTLDRAEQRLLLRDRPRRAAELAWSPADVPLLDEARALVAGPPRGYGHVIVDEAQDLSPMQLRMVARRAPSGALTILGDLAQGTGPVVYRSWAEVGSHLPGVDLHVEELRHAYRVPAEIMELALPLLERIAPDVEPPVAYRTGGDPPLLRRVAPGVLLEEALREAGRLAELDGQLAVIAPPSLAAALPRGHTFDETEVAVLTPRQAKGLEFDHVVVVEPAAIVDEGGDQGLRELYVALTRPTKTLVVVHAAELPF